MDRNQKLKLNTIVAIARQAAAVIFGLILPRYILSYFGSEVNGLIQSITQFLGFISLLEMGIGPVIQSNLYKPLADGDNAAISQIFRSASKFFRNIGLIFSIYVVVLVFVYPRFVNDGFDMFYTASLVVIISISTFAEYFWGITYQLLLNADQLAFIQLGLQIIFLFLNTVISVILMKAGCSIQVVKLASSVIYLLRPATLSWYVRHHYQLDYKIQYEGEPIQQKWNGFTQHLAAVITQRTDVIVLTVLSTLESVSIYTVYHLVVQGLQQLVLNSAVGVEAMWGNMLAKGENETLIKSFSRTEFFIHALVTAIFSITAVAITPFVMVYTSGITDADYNAPVFGYLLTFAYAVQCLRIPYFRMIKAAGHYKQTQNAALIQAIINIVISIILVFKFGLIGVAIGTFISMAYHTIYFAVYLSKNIINRSFSIFLKHIICDFLATALILFICGFVKYAYIGYLDWILKSILVSIISIFIVAFFNAIFFLEDFINFVRPFTCKLFKNNG